MFDSKSDNLSNPFRVGNDNALGVEPCVVVIFGATGDLTGRKLVPALYNLAVDGFLPAQYHLLGFARRPKDDSEFRDDLKLSVEQHSRRKPLDAQVWGEFAERIGYVSSNFDDPSGYQRLRQRLEDIDKITGCKCNRIFYFATAPRFFETIALGLKEAGLLDSENEGTEKAVSPRARVIVEKPFGHDLKSAQDLNRRLLNCMKEEQIYRIDHYLGKETVQNLLVFRFANGIFEPIWNHKYIDHVEISVCESIGVGSRAGYFDKSGIMRDIVQNHLLQLLCLVALEPPVAFEADAVRDEKVKVLRSVRRIRGEEIERFAVRGRYQSGYVAGEDVPGYVTENGVAEDSVTETYAAVRLSIDNWRWAGVPFFVRAGKRLPKRITEISIHFRHVPHLLFQGQDVSILKPNILSFQIQPDEGISLRMSSKPPGPSVRVQSVKMDFSYGSSFGLEPPEAYERLILDCMRADPTLFTRNDEIEEAWDLVDGIIEAWSDKHGKIPIYGYQAGTWGPSLSDEMLLREIRRPWRKL